MLSGSLISDPSKGDLVIRVNYEKFEVAFRNKRLVGLAEQITSTVTSRVYETLLARIELQTPRCRGKMKLVPEGEEEEHYSVAVPVHSISEDLDPHLDLAGVIAGQDNSTTGRTNKTLSHSGRGKRPLENESVGLDGDSYDEAGNSHGQNRIDEIEQHLSLLAQEPHIFSTRFLESGINTWAVEYRHLVRELRHLELERIIESRFGSFAVRIVRILAAKGKLDERRLQEISLMASKDLRQILARMQAAGFIDLQEVPRDGQRQPSRAIYLWFYDADRVRMMVLEDTYKTMSRCLQRMAVERKKLKWFLEKTERTDVKGNEQRYLSAAELKTLQEWREKEALLLGEVGRLDDLVAVLRDY
jgi:DNA-directed RNA polymerase III subunit RPC3